MIKENEFEEIYKILEQSFEPFLHRGYKRQKELLKNEKYNIIKYEEDGELIGFLTYWEINKNLYFVEHFAVNPQKRGGGIGKKIFNEFLKLDGDKILEVEPPHTENDKRRIKLYESLGLIFHEDEYYQPPYNLNDEKTRLHIMCSKKLDEKDFDKFIRDIYKNVYNVEKEQIFN